MGTRLECDQFTFTRINNILTRGRRFLRIIIMIAKTFYCNSRSNCVVFSLLDKERLTKQKCTAATPEHRLCCARENTLKKQQNPRPKNKIKTRNNNNSGDEEEARGKWSLSKTLRLFCTSQLLPAEHEKERKDFIGRHLIYCGSFWQSLRMRERCSLKLQIINN